MFYILSVVLLVAAMFFGSDSMAVMATMWFPILSRSEVQIGSTEAMNGFLDFDQPDQPLTVRDFSGVFHVIGGGNATSAGVIKGGAVSRASDTTVNISGGFWGRDFLNTDTIAAPLLSETIDLTTKGVNAVIPSGATYSITIGTGSPSYYAIMVIWDSNRNNPPAGLAAFAATQEQIQVADLPSGYDKFRVLAYVPVIDDGGNRLAQFVQKGEGETRSVHVAEDHQVFSSDSAIGVTNLGPVPGDATQLKLYVDFDDGGGADFAWTVTQPGTLTTTFDYGINSTFPVVVTPANQNGTGQVRLGVNNDGTATLTIRLSGYDFQV